MDKRTQPEYGFLPEIECGICPQPQQAGMNGYCYFFAAESNWQGRMEAEEKC